MSDTAAKPEVSDEVKAQAKQSNDDRKRDRLERKARRAHEWRVQVWAQSELAIRAANAELEILNGEVYQPYQPEFDNEQMLHHYANMTLPK